MSTVDKYWDSYYQAIHPNIVYDNDNWVKCYSDYFINTAAVLDLGSGSGSNIPFLLGMCSDIHAADISEAALDLIKKKYPGIVKCHRFDMREGFPFLDNSFDVVIADLSLHYFTMKDTKRIISEIRRILKNGGLLLARVHSDKNSIPPYSLMIEPGLYNVEGYQRKYFTVSEIRFLFAGWHFLSIVEKIIHRYNKDKAIIEFAVNCKKS